MPNKTEIFFFSVSLYRIIFYNFFSWLMRDSSPKDWFTILWTSDWLFWGKSRLFWRYSKTPSWNDYVPHQECHIWSEKSILEKDSTNGRNWIQGGVVMEKGISLRRLQLNLSRRYLILVFVPKATPFTAENLQPRLVFSLCIRYWMSDDLLVA